MANWDMQALMAKIETTYGTDSVPTGTVNAVLGQNVRYTPMEATEVKRQHARPFQGNRPSMLVGKQARITFEVEAKASGTAGTPPAYGVFLRCCKCAEVIVPTTSVTYNGISGNGDSCSIYFNVDGTLYKIIGARGTFQYKLNADGIVVIEFTMTGLFTLPVSQALPAVTYGSQMTEIPQVAVTENVPTFSIGAFAAAALRNFTFNKANEVKYRGLIGRRQIILPTCAEAVEFQIEAEPLATFNPFAIADSEAPQAISLVHGLGAGKVVTLTMPSVQILNPGDLANVDSVVETQLRGSVLPTGNGNNQFTLAFT
ncbi:phage tail tube protein [Paracoccus sp. IB05]|uniref:phage tail tube protein n=1 Tax=Paracoccus sp. IB05 TaxID=2779367 RepID=UPI0018E8DA87|nr:phage tail tube protein [Paracoccus sp. IB05]MBJ2150605.1 hypothetical protein [Paracoccus sp. IB05]